MTRLIVALGNPGDEYSKTRHNFGFMIADRYVAKKRGRFTETKRDYHLATLRIKGQHLYVAKPMTFMNLSGTAVKLLLNRLQLTPADILVVCDDFALPFGKLRVRRGGSDGGHNGLGSIIEEIGTTDFPRLRCGIGPCPEGIASPDFVLTEFSSEELDGVDDFVKLVLSCLETVVYRGLKQAMNKFNGS